LTIDDKSGGVTFGNHLPYWYSIRNSLGGAIAAAGFKASRVNLTSETATLVRRI
jgi:hypothetical protein